MSNKNNKAANYEFFQAQQPLNDQFSETMLHKFEENPQ